DCPPKKLEEFAESPYDDLRRAVAKNPHCPPELLQQLAQDKNSYVRRAVANNPNCPPAETMRDIYLEQFTKSAIPT
ncbi:hypothetical protein IQ225_19275, partial [Synechocystis salina LEGE 06155]|nr:hypothetical protein [Synechocystis salina LEGE 06155]